MRRARCAACGAKLPARSKFCPDCGTAVASGDTAVQEVPPAEPAPTPVESHVSERRYFGVPPVGVLLGLAFVGLIAAIVLFATGQWPWGLIAVGIALFLFTGAASAERNSPGGERSASRAFSSARSRAGVAKETIAAQGSARLELARLRREASALAKQRSVRARELGEAVYAKNTTATKELKQRMKEIDDELAAKEAQMVQVTMDAQERIGKARLQVQPTQVVAAEASGEAHGPAVVPEPSPPPDEGQPPEPAVVPEPSPPPDEGQPPEPAVVPEPSPPPDEGDRPTPPEIPEPTPQQGSN